MNAAKGVDKMYHIQHAYAGIGSRQITSEEASILRGLGARLASLGFWLYSGNATGADQAFEEGADDRAGESPRVWRRAPDLSHTFVVDPVVA
jgi:predicted Rossmann fold nucleotide-binding protein DprA/Smf involved in DNA uptake